ncbi:MAG: DUF4124 domain-containing protein [Gammaproteobacteria bacterium]|nr:MAG: DUF4124 domain-containing protein [Gammaproteobacteria bacterium]
MSLGYRLLAALALLSAMALPAAAQVYKQVDEHGNVTYTDNPPADEKGAEPLKLPAINTQPALQPKPKPSKKASESSGYEEVSILSPAQDATIPPGQLNVVVQVFLKPALKPGHLVQLLHNGQPQGEPAYATSFSIDQLIRGEHSLQARVVDEEGTVIASSSAITIHVKRASRLNKPAAKGNSN